MMAVQYAPTKLRVPPGFQNLLEGLSREVLREQPANIIQFAANYFKDQLVIRNETGVDVAEKGSNMEKLMKDEEIDIDLNDPSTADAAMKIQAVFRGHKSRQESRQKKEEEVAATKIQAGFRGHQARKSVKDMKSLSEIEKGSDDAQAGNDADEQEEREYVKSVIVNENAEELLDDKESNYNDPAYEKAATKIQAGFRGYKTREDMKGKLSTSNTELPVQNDNDDNNNEQIGVETDAANEEEAAIKIQASFRGHKARKEVDAIKSTQSQDTPAHTEHEAAAVKIQAGYRGYVARKEVDKMKSEKNEDLLPENASAEDSTMEDAAVKIQAGFRGYVARKEVDELRESKSKDETAKEDAAVKIQAGFRGYVARKEVDELRESKSKEDTAKEDAAVKIQAGFRGYVARKEVEKMKDGQGNTIEEGEATKEDDDDEELAKAATKIQASFRGYKTRANLQQDRNDKSNEAIDESTAEDNQNDN